MRILQNVPKWRTISGMEWQEKDYYPDNKQKALYKEFKFNDFVTALEFVNKVGAIAEQMQHHPDINLSWGRVSVWTTTHDAHKVTAKDHEFAKKIDQIKH
jgi:4a-hydroxytetrahydrobiopterin dehydratase